MDSAQKKALREQYNNRHPDMGIVCWQKGDEMWVDMSTDAKADYNGTSFQLKLGSWPNKQLQKAYTENPDAFNFSLIKELDYEDFSEDHQDDLKLLLLEFLEEHPNAKPMRMKYKYNIDK